MRSWASRAGSARSASRPPSRPGSPRRAPPSRSRDLPARRAAERSGSRAQPRACAGRPSSGRAAGRGRAGIRPRPRSPRSRSFGCRPRRSPTAGSARRATPRSCRAGRTRAARCSATGRQPQTSRRASWPANARATDGTRPNPSQPTERRPRRSGVRHLRDRSSRSAWDHWLRRCVVGFSVSLHGAKAPEGWRAPRRCSQ